MALAFRIRPPPQQLINIVPPTTIHSSRQKENEITEVVVYQRNIICHCITYPIDLHLNMGDKDRRTLLPPDDDILSYLRSRRRPEHHATRKIIQKHLNSNAPCSHVPDNTNVDGIWTKSEVKDALKRLVKRGAITKNGKEYFCSSTADAIDEGDVPIAQRMRRQITQQFGNNDKTNSEESNTIDLDDEIRRLEEELAEEESEDDDDFDDDDESENVDDGSDDESDDSKSHDIIDDHHSNGIIRLSNLANDRIEPLPQSALPQSKRRHMKGVDTAADHMEESTNNHRKKRKQSRNEQGEHTVSEGLKAAVQDLLQNYVRPSQLDRPPFYCRVCQHQATTQSEFDLHRTSEFHKVAVKEEQKKSYCKLCRKQLTSVVQMEEHLSSKPHRDRMDFVKGKQRRLIGNSAVGGGGDANGGRGRGVMQKSGQNQRGFAKSDSSGRQWC
ncbi:hypothetical protein ACHAWU_009315 [Discostella pseudostelligera]|uniref:U1-type domain-containing protein n=1 Tax=Discostella pseudostelligera TaxID=259834 RepID=A0ABD3N6D4_9STRA